LDVQHSNPGIGGILLEKQVFWLKALDVQHSNPGIGGILLEKQVFRRCELLAKLESKDI
jgi:hypothetical protein